MNLHTRLDPFEVRDGCLCIGGKTLPEIAAEIGSTPFYLYDSERLRARVARLRQALPADVSLHYAIKANPMPAVVELLAGLVDGLDVASGRELDTALTTGTKVADISFAGPGKSIPELEQAVRAGITLNVESATELKRIAAIAEQLDALPPVAIRVNPDFELKSSGMKMAGGPKQFGIDAEQVPALLATMSDLPVRFRGFHIFSGSQNLRPEAICEAQVKAFELAVRLAENAPTAIDMLNIGGGFGIPYFPGDEPLNLSPIGDNLANLLEQRDERLPGTEIMLELGRYLVGEGGIYVCEVTDRKVSRGQVFLVTNGGLHHHLAASGNFGQVIRKNYPVTIGNRIANEELESQTVVGPLCTPLDLLADRMSLPRADVGDLVVVFQSGAYGFSASPQLFLSHPLPSEHLY